MSTLRELEICQGETGGYYFTIIEENKRIFTSDLYLDNQECAEIGMSMLDEMHEKSPLRSTDTPRHLVGFPGRKHDQNE